MKRQKSIIFITLLIEVLGISIIIPAFPELKIYYGISDFEVTLGLTIYSLFAFLSAPILWQRSDKIGRKTSLLWCIAWTAASYFMMLIQPRFRLFLFARAINGITWGNISIIQAILTDISPDKETKNKNFWLLWAFFGLGFIIWPVLGSLLLSRWWVETIFWVWGVLASMQLLMLYIWFHNTNTLNISKTFQYNPFRTFQKYFARWDLKPWLLSFTALGIWVFIINSTQSLYMFNNFWTLWEEYWLYLWGVWVISAINLAVLMPKFWSKKFTNQQLLIRCFLWLVWWYTVLIYINTELSYILLYYLVVFMSGTHSVIFNIEIMSQANEWEVWELSGMLASLQSVFMIFGPLLGGIMLTWAINIHIWAVVFSIIGAGIMWYHIYTKKVLT